MSDRLGLVAWVLGWAVHLLCFGWVAAHCLKTRRESTSALLWIFLSWSFPVVGPLLYLSFGVDRLPRKGWRKRVHDRQFLAERRAREGEAFPLAYWKAMVESVRAEPVDPALREVDRALDALLPDFPLLGGNRVLPLVGGVETFAAMRQAVSAARHHVHVSTFILGNDRTGREFMDLFAAKAREGVAVRLLYDRFGSTAAMWAGLFRRYRGIRNLSIEGWTQANPLKRQFQVNLRNHRKIMVVDGRRAFCGGINLHDPEDGRHGPYRDYHFDISGPAVLELQYTFLRDWNFMTDEGPERLLHDGHFPEPARAGHTRVRLVNSGPTDEMGAFADAIFTAMTCARREVLVVTPYFVPTPDILTAMRSAAVKGVDVRLVVPEWNNHPCAGLAGAALYEVLMAAGVRIYLRPRPFMHAKACVIDDTFALVGTGNLDVRSFRLNYETNLAIFGTEFANAIKAVVLDDLGQSRQLSEGGWAQRSALRKLAENAASLMTPVL